MKKENIKKSIFWIAAIITITTGILYLSEFSWFLSIGVIFLLLILEAFLLLRNTDDIIILFNSIDIYIEDTEGKKVKLKKHSRIKALKNNVDLFVEKLSSDGQINNFWVSTGEIKNIQKEEGMIILETTLGRELNKGEEMERGFSCEYIDSFSNKMEYWIIRRGYPTQKTNIIIHFPTERSLKELSGVIKSFSSEKPAKNQPYSKIIDGKPCILLEVNENILKHNQYYKILWRW